MVDVVKAVVICLVVAVAILLGCCCHYASLKRREEEMALRNSRTMQQTENTNQNTVPVPNREGSNPIEGQRQPIQTPPEETPQSPDAIADSGPPSYSCLAASGDTQLPDLPPPSYDEAVRASTEHLAVTRQERFV